MLGSRTRSVHANVAQSLSVTTVAEKEGSQTVTEKIEAEIQTEKILPTNFEKFVPWASLQWQCEKAVTVVRKKRELYIPISSIKKTQKLKFKKHESVHVMSSDMRRSPAVVTDATALTVTIYYDDYDRLDAIEIFDPPFTIPCQVIKAINLALPFHRTLTKLTINKGGLSALILNNIAQGLYTSSIKELCLDDTFVQQGNYHILLDQLSQLTYLSLSRCRINDAVTKSIVSRLKIDCRMSKVLQVLDLSSNLISDEGAEAIEDTLRSNRCLLHINLAGNQITDRGAAIMLNILEEFVLSDEEVLAMKWRRIKYFKVRQEIYAEFLKEEFARRLRSQSMSGRSPPAKRSAAVSPARKTLTAKKSAILDEQEVAEMNTNKAVGERFTDVFDNFNTVRKDGHLYCLGNFTIASINFAYNNMEILSLRKIVNVLKYQSHVTKLSKTTGLMRLVLDGNNIPGSCEELELIEMYLKRIIVENIPVFHKKRTSKDKQKIRT